MKFETIRKMEETVKAYTSIEQLNGDIEVMSQGETLRFRNIGRGKTMDVDNQIYMADETADSYRIAFERDGDSIKVIETKLSRV